MHPFYGPSARLVADPATARAGLISMAAYLAFWAAVTAIGLRELNARFPRRQSAAGSGTDAALSLVRERYARGEIDRPQFLQMVKDIQPGQGRATASTVEIGGRR